MRLYTVHTYTLAGSMANPMQYLSLPSQWITNTTAWNYKIFLTYDIRGPDQLLRNANCRTRHMVAIHHHI